MDVVSALVAYLKPPEAVHPQQSSFHDPPVSPKLLTGFDASAGYPRRYAPLSQSLATPGELVSLIGVQLLGALARSAAGPLDRRDGIHDLLQDLGVVDVGR